MDSTITKHHELCGPIGDASSQSIAASLLHRIRNPLSVITTAASLLQEDGELPQGSDLSMVAAILKAAEQIEILLRRFSQYACPEPPTCEPVDINQLCRSEIDRLLKDGAAGRKRPGIEFGPSTPIGQIACDHFLIGIALAELLDNAIEACDRQGLVTMRTDADDHSLEIVIEDNGHGIPEEVSEKIRQPFYTTRQGRSGLGLPIAEGIIAAHGGRIDYESQAGGGTRVRLVLPITNRE